MSGASPAFIVSGAQVLRTPLPLENGHVGIGYVTIEYGALLISGLLLVRYADGEFGIRLPQASRSRRIVVHGHKTRAALLEAAVNAYRALGGEHADMPLATAPHKMEPSLEHSTAT